VLDNESSGSEQDAEELFALRREANMPIDEVLATNYNENKESCLKNLSPMLKPKKSETVGDSSSKSKSPIKMDLDDTDTKDSPSKEDSSKHSKSETNGSSTNGSSKPLTNGNKDDSKPSELNGDCKEKENGEAKPETEVTTKNGNTKKYVALTPVPSEDSKAGASVGYTGKGNVNII